MVFFIDGEANFCSAPEENTLFEEHPSQKALEQQHKAQSLEAQTKSPNISPVRKMQWNPRRIATAVPGNPARQNTPANATTIRRVRGGARRGNSFLFHALWNRHPEGKFLFRNGR